MHTFGLFLMDERHNKKDCAGEIPHGLFTRKALEIQAKTEMLHIVLFFIQQSKSNA